MSGFDAAVAAGYQEIYILTASGIIKHQSLRPGKDGKQRFIRVPVKGIPGAQVPKLKVVHPQINFLPDGKIPIRLLSEVKAFFKKVIEKRGTAVEAMIWIMWNQEAGYHLLVPNQKVSHASATYDWSCVPAGSSIIVDIHSHADFSAFFSGTDNADDKGSIRYSGVIGHNNTDKQDMVWRFNCQPSPIEVKFEDLFMEPV
jgi:PRTRC genetic system protein A